MKVKNNQTIGIQIILSFTFLLVFQNSIAQISHKQTIFATSQKENSSLNKLLAQESNELKSSNISFTPIDALTLSNNQTLDLVSWNVEWFGAPEKSNHATTFDEQLNYVSAKIIELDADIYALQEVVVDDLNGNYLDSLVIKLNTDMGTNTFTGLLGPRYSLDDREPTKDFPAQRVCYIYKNETITNLHSESMFSDIYPNTDVSYIEGYTGNAYSFWASGRLPFLLNAEVNINGISAQISFINIHAKCCYDSKDRKVADALFLKAELNKNFSEENVVVLGDYNDYYEGSMSGGESPYITWFENTNIDYLRASGASIDHISISNELYYEYQTLTNNYSVESTSISDHDPVVLRLMLNNENINGQIIKLDDIPNMQFKSAPYTINAQSSLSLPIEYEIISGPASLVDNILTTTDVGTVLVKAFNNGDNNTLEASEQKQFIVIKASQTIEFDLPSEINLSEQKIQLEASSSEGLIVNFRIISGNGIISENELSFAEAGDIIVEAYQDGNNQYFTASISKTISVIDNNANSILNHQQYKFDIYPNPSNGIIHINHNFRTKNSILKIYNSVGIYFESHILEKKATLNLSHLNSGLYILIIESNGTLISNTLILK